MKKLIFMAAFAIMTVLGAAAQDADSRYATELLTRLLDMGFMRQIGLAKRRMAQLPDGEEKITLLGQITRMETARKDLQAQIYGNTVG